MDMTIGPYLVEREIGRGARGVVYRATDSRLGRPVAIKALPDAWMADADRLARFDREARTLASLSHPNLGAIYGVEEQNGRTFLVLEYIEGETLAERLDRGPLQVEEALELCRDIAAGMEAAHNAGVVHRDLKPDNIRITPEGRVKVLDFGLAKADEGSSSLSGSSGAGGGGGAGGGAGVGSDSPTMTTPMRAGPSQTIPGAIMGTAAYMSPEQARGRKVDKRTDVWSFGVLLYECLTGVSPFAGDSATDSMGAVLHKDIDLNALPPGTPVRVRDLLSRMLARDRDRRMRDLGDAMLELDRAIGEVDAGDGAPAAPRRGARRFLVAAALLLGAAGVAFGLLNGRGGVAPISGLVGGGVKAPPTVRVRQATDDEGLELWPSISPDGTTLLYVALDGGDFDIFSQRIGGYNAINLTGDSPANDIMPAFSPDGQMIVFRSERDGGGLFRMGATGESPLRLTSEGYDPEWSPHGESVAYSMEGVYSPMVRNAAAAVWVVSVGSGDKRMLLEADGVQPAWSPSGARIACWRVDAGGQRDLFTIPASGGEPVAITNDSATDWSPCWAPDGKSLFFLSDRGGSQDVWRMPIDEATGRALGPPAPVTTSPGSQLDGLAIARRTGRLAFTSGTQHGWLARLDLDPESLEAKGDPAPIMNVTTSSVFGDLSPDGRSIVYVSSADTQEDLFIVGIDGAHRRRLTNDAARDRWPVWSPDGKSITFYSDRTGKYLLWTINTDGSGLATLGPREIEMVQPKWSPDGQTMLALSRAPAMHIVKPHADPPVIEPMPAGPNGMVVVDAAWSPTGDRLLTLLRGDQSLALAIFDMATQKYELLTENETTVGTGGSVFHPDGRRVLSLSGRNLDVIDVKSRKRRTIWSAPEHVTPAAARCVSPEGDWVLMSLFRTASDVWIADMNAAN